MIAGIAAIIFPRSEDADEMRTILSTFLEANSPDSQAFRRDHTSRKEYSIVSRTRRRQHGATLTALPDPHSVQTRLRSARQRYDCVSRSSERVCGAAARPALRRRSTQRGAGRAGSGQRHIWSTPRERRHQSGPLQQGLPGRCAEWHAHLGAGAGSQKPGTSDAHYEQPAEHRARRTQEARRQYERKCNQSVEYLDRRG